MADVGCGPGQITAHLAMAGADVTGFDLSPGMVDEARRRFPDLPFEVADLTALPRGGWAAITSWYSLVHLAPPDLPGAIAALARLARSRAAGSALAVHEGAERRHLDEWFGHEVDLDFSFHRRETPCSPRSTPPASTRSSGTSAARPAPRDARQRLYVLARRLSP